MDLNLKTLWLSALRSGEYEQTTGKLKSGNSYCCLGVLCHVAREHAMLPDGVEVLEGSSALTVQQVLEENDWISAQELPPGLFIKGELASEAMSRNDGSDAFEGNRQSFKQIADWLEQVL